MSAKLLTVGGHVCSFETLACEHGRNGFVALNYCAECGAFKHTFSDFPARRCHNCQGAACSPDCPNCGTWQTVSREEWRKHNEAESSEVRYRHYRESDRADGELCARRMRRVIRLPAPTRAWIQPELMP